MQRAENEDLEKRDYHVNKDLYGKILVPDCNTLGYRKGY